jgi:uncharacterized protein
MEPDLGPIQLVVIQPTPYCNLDCDYCYLPDRNSKARLSIELLESIFERIFRSNLAAENFTIVWHAGEPLAMPIDFYESAFKSIEQLNQDEFNSYYQITHAFQTNATLVSSEWCDLFRRHRIQVGVSLDGPAFLHDAHRKTRSGLGTHASAMRGIQQLRAKDLPFHVITVLTQDSLEHADEIFHFFVEHHLLRVGFNIEEKEGVNISSSFSSPGAEDGYQKFMQEFLRLTKESNLHFEIREFEHLKHFIYHGPPARMTGQFSPFNILTIDYKGNFSTFSPELLSMKSSIYGDFILGNVLTDSIRSSITHNKFKAIFNDIRTGIELCQRSCEYFSVCGGGAPANKYFENGSFSSTETMYCRCNIKILTDILLDDIEVSLGMSGSSF